MSGNTFSGLPELPMPFQESDRFYVARGNKSYQASPDPSIAGTGFSFGIGWAIFQIRQPGGESGGAFTPPGTWIERPFNYEDPLNEFGAITPFPNTGRRIELPSGHYAVLGWLTAMENAGMRCRLCSVDGTVSPIYGASVYSMHYSWHIPLDGLLLLTKTTQLVVEMHCDRNRSKPWGYGYRTNIDPEIYGSLMFLRRSF